MAEKQRPGIAYVVSLCGIMCGLSLALMFCLLCKPILFSVVFEQIRKI